MALKALIAMSGGVDSSVAALITKQAGYECVGCTMRLFDGEDGTEGKCCSLDDVEDARSVAQRLGMPYYVFNFTADFKTAIIDKFAGYYLRGLTPNPCIDCNRYMKFGKLSERAAVLGCDKIVTGHYARVEQDPASGLYKLKKALDPAKDQSYVLYSMDQHQLEHTLFPLGGMDKKEVRAIAAENGFLNAHKPDSQDICFIPDGDVGAAVKKYAGVSPEPGDFVDEDGKVLGKHGGICKYTVGQRKGLGIAYEYPLYVKKIDVANNRVILGGGGSVFAREAKVRDINWISGFAPGYEIECSVRVRYHAPESKARLKISPDGKTADVIFESPQRAVTPGQAAVFYNGDEVLGGGEIAPEN